MQITESRQCSSARAGGVAAGGAEGAGGFFTTFSAA